MHAGKLQSVLSACSPAVFLIFAASVGVQSVQSSSGALATVSGRAIFVGGPCGAQAINSTPCTVSSQAGAGVRLSITPVNSEEAVVQFITGDDGRFSVTLKPGIYRIRLLQPSLNFRFDGYSINLLEQESLDIEIPIELLRP